MRWHSPSLVCGWPTDVIRVTVWFGVSHAILPRVLGCTRLLGMTSGSWPRSANDDPLLPHHLLARRTLHPIAIAERDRIDFEVIRAGTRETLILSRSQRSAMGGLLSPSSLWPGNDIVRKRDRIPSHAFSESDRLLARPADAGKSDRVRASRQCWRQAGVHPHRPLCVGSPAALAAQEVSQNAPPRDPSPVLATPPGPCPIPMGRSTSRRDCRTP